MKKALSLIVALAMVLSIFTAIPLVSTAVEATFKASLSYTYGSSAGKAVTMHNHPTRPYALSWSSSSDGYRTGYIAIPFGDADLTDQAITKAILNLTVSKTQNMNESNSGLKIYAVEYEAITDTSSHPESDILLADFTPPSAIQSQNDYTYPIAIEVDLSEYFESYPASSGIGLLITNRDDQYNLRGMIGFYGYDEDQYAPSLTLFYGKEASVKLSLQTSDSAYSDSVEIGSLREGDEFTIPEDIAPPVLHVSGKYYLREELPPVTLTAGINNISVKYEQITISEVLADGAADSVTYIQGGTPALPGSLDVVTDKGVKLNVPVDWVKTDEHEDNAYYETSLGGVTYRLKASAIPCDGYVSSPAYSGSSDGASFSDYNYLGLDFNGGKFIADTYFSTSEGTNKLIAYGSENAGSFADCSALLRYMNTKANGNYVFEYYNNGWLQSNVVCEYGVNYILRTIVDVTNRTYDLYISSRGGSFVQINSSPASFRGSYNNIDRVFYFGGVAVSDQRVSWIEGSSVLTLNMVSNGSVLKSEQIKTASGVVYTASNTPKLIESDSMLYMIVSNNPVSKVVAPQSDTLDIEYENVSVSDYSPIDIVIVQGDSTVNLPASVNITFSNGKTLPCSLLWDSSDVDKETVGEYTALGYIENTSATITANFKVRKVENLPYTGKNTVATNNGGWNWYVEPSGTHIAPGDELASRYESGIYLSNNGYKFCHDKTYMGWVEDEGTIVVAELDHDTDQYKRVELHPFLESDDHNNPAVVVLPDGRIMVFYSMHTNEPYMYYCVTTNPEDISQWNPWQRYYCYTEAEDRTYNATYPSVFIVHDDEGIVGNDVIYVGWRGVHWKPTFAKFSIPDENGVCKMVMNQTQFANTTYGYSTYDNADAPNAKNDGGYTDSGRRPYTKYDYDFERNKIYITFTANHPDNDKRNHIYYIYLDIADQNLYTAKDNLLQPLPKENNSSYQSRGAKGTNGQWGIVTVDLVSYYPELLIFDASEQTGQSFNPRNGNAERRGWTWDISHNEKGEPCVVYVDVTATPPDDDGSLPEKYLGESNGNSRSHHYYWYARWDSAKQEWVKTYLTYGGKWFHENATQERCYSGGLTFDHNADDANVIYLAIPTMGDYGNIFEIYRWESEDHGATWTIREPLTQNSKINNARPNAIYNYRVDENGSHAGPRLLWISGEYRYWMNYEYKTGVMTDYSSDGFITQDSPEMFADPSLYANGEKIDILPVGDNISLTGRFDITNISIGEGAVMTALAHYDKNNALKSVTTAQTAVPGRSVPQIGMIGAPKMPNGSLSTLGDPEFVSEIDYTANIQEGDRISLLAWNAGVEHPMSSIISVPFSATTEKNSYLMTETFHYEGTQKLILDEDETLFNGWIGKAYGSSPEISDNNYAAITKAPFGNTALHLYRTTNNGNTAIMASHKLPDTNGKDYRISFTMRYINEMSWNNTDNAGFTLSHGTPVYNDPSSPCALQFRHKVVWQEENGRGTSGHVRDTRWFDGGSQTQIFVETDGPDGVGFKNDALMVGALYRVVINVHPAAKTIDFTINDGHRTFNISRDYVDSASFDWDSNPIDTITFSVGNSKWGEIYVDDLYVEVIN